MLSVFAGTEGRAATTSRRELLRLGGLSLLGLSATGLSRLQAASGVSGASEKSCVFIFLFGGPSHIDLWDMKPNAPVEVRGDFHSVETNVPGIRLCEHLPNLAKQMDKLCLIRSMHHRMPVHGPACSEIYTGREYPLPPITDEARPEDWPSLSSLATRFGNRRGGMPSALVTPWHSQFHGQTQRIAGQTGGRMGEQFNPFLMQADLKSAEFDPRAFYLPDGFEGSRLDERRQLLTALDAAARGSLGESRSVGVLKRHQDTAFSMLADGRIARAIDLSREPEATRDRYGSSIFGKSLLAARRLVEAGVSLVTVNWHDESLTEKVSPLWDQHNEIFPTLKNRMTPIFDRAMASFLGDLHDRGLLDSTLVLATGEFGRTPKIGQFTQNAMTEKTGRDHWPHAFTVLAAGGGAPGGHVYGATDRLGGHVKDRPVTPADLAATVLERLEIDPKLRYWDNFQQREQLVCEGSPIDWTA